MSRLLTEVAIRAIEDHGDYDTIPDQENAARHFAEAFLAAQDRDSLAADLADAWCGDSYVGDLPPRDWTRWYRVVDALLGPER